MTVRLARLFVAMPIIASIALLSAASRDVPAAIPLYGDAASPSKLDYLVLASLADSSNLLAMSAYRAPEKGGQGD